MTKQLQEGLQAKNRLMLAQKLMVAIISLKKAERVLGEVDAKIAAGKAALKKYGDAAEDIAESMKRSEADHVKEMADMKDKVAKLRTDLGTQQSSLDSLVAKRARIADTVSRWKEHVSTLRDAHEAAAAPPGARLRRRDPLDVPEPPSALGILGDLGVVPPSPPRNPSDAMPAVAAVATAAAPSAPFGACPRGCPRPSAHPTPTRTPHPHCAHPTQMLPCVRWWQSAPLQRWGRAVLQRRVTVAVTIVTAALPLRTRRRMWAVRRRMSAALPPRAMRMMTERSATPMPLPALRRCTVTRRTAAPPCALERLVSPCASRICDTLPGLPACLPVCFSACTSLACWPGLACLPCDGLS
ncbi:MAG: hypothetical protein M9934_09330 [Thermomicrobiales bacterium]|nr:hypothetical protein [Thermomicrobiales bacterium]